MCRCSYCYILDNLAIKTQGDGSAFVFFLISSLLTHGNLECIIDFNI